MTYKREDFVPGVEFSYTTNYNDPSIEEDHFAHYKVTELPEKYKSYEKEYPQYFWVESQTSFDNSGFFSISFIDSIEQGILVDFKFYPKELPYSPEQMRDEEDDI